MNKIKALTLPLLAAVTLNGCKETEERTEKPLAPQTEATQQKVETQIQKPVIDIMIDPDNGTIIFNAKAGNPDEILEISKQFTFPDNYESFHDTTIALMGAFGECIPDIENKNEVIILVVYPEGCTRMTAIGLIKELPKFMITIDEKDGITLPHINNLEPEKQKEFENTIESMLTNLISEHQKIYYPNDEAIPFDEAFKESQTLIADWKKQMSESK